MFFSIFTFSLSNCKNMEWKVREEIFYPDILVNWCQAISNWQDTHYSDLKKNSNASLSQGKIETQWGSSSLYFSCFNSAKDATKIWGGLPEHLEQAKEEEDCTRAEGWKATLPATLVLTWKNIAPSFLVRLRGIFLVHCLAEESTASVEPQES